MPTLFARRLIGNNVILRSAEGGFAGEGFGLFAFKPPKWLYHIMSSFFVHQDMVLLHHQEATDTALGGARGRTQHHHASLITYASQLKMGWKGRTRPPKPPTRPQPQLRQPIHHQAPSLTPTPPQARCMRLGARISLQSAKVACQLYSRGRPVLHLCRPAATATARFQPPSPCRRRPGEQQVSIVVGQGHHHGERGRGHEGLLGDGAVPPDVVDRSRAGMGWHGMQSYFVQLVHVSANLVCHTFDTRKNHYRCAKNAYF